MVAAGGGGSAGQTGTGQAPPSRVSFNRDVRPIMSGTCFRCHGPDESSRRADMRLDIREEAFKTRRNGTPIVPGRSEASLIITRIFAEDPSRVMPPAAIHKELTAAQKETIRRWIAEGAEYEGQGPTSSVRRLRCLHGPLIRSTPLSRTASRAKA